MEYLDDLVSENLILHDHVWTTQEGETKAIKDIDDDHLKNIVTHLRKQGGFNSGINKEYQKRFGEAPVLSDVEDLSNYEF